MFAMYRYDDSPKIHFSGSIPWRVPQINTFTLLGILSLSFYWIFFFSRNTVQTHTLTYTCIYSPLWTHTRTPYPYEHLRKTEPVDWILKLTKSPHASRCWREHRLPLNEYFHLYKTLRCQTRVWNLVGWRYNYTPNHPISDWFYLSDSS
jgi:hypothetical protein